MTSCSASRAVSATTVEMWRRSRWSVYSTSQSGVSSSVIFVSSAVSRRCVTLERQAEMGAASVAHLDQQRFVFGRTRQFKHERLLRDTVVLGREVQGDGAHAPVDDWPVVLGHLPLSSPGSAGPFSVDAPTYLIQRGSQQLCYAFVLYTLRSRVHKGAQQ